MKKFIYAMVVALFTVGSVSAQTVGTIGVGDISYSAKSSELRSKENIITAINSGINNALVKTRKFTVLDYAQLTQRLEKQNLELKKYYDKSYTSTEYWQAGLDYILVADVTDFGLYKQKRAKSQTSVGSIDISFKLLGVADVTDDVESSITAQAIGTVTLSDVEASQDLLDQTIKKGIDKLITRIVARLFPIRVMQISDNGTIKLNYGAGLLSPGDTVLVYDDKDGPVFNSAGEVVAKSIATLQITEAEKRFSKAQALNGFNAIKKQQIGQLTLSGS